MQESEVTVQRPPNLTYDASGCGTGWCFFAVFYFHGEYPILSHPILPADLGLGGKPLHSVGLQPQCSCKRNLQSRKSLLTIQNRPGSYVFRSPVAAMHTLRLEHSIESRKRVSGDSFNLVHQVLCAGFMRSRERGEATWVVRMLSSVWQRQRLRDPHCCCQWDRIIGEQYVEKTSSRRSTLLAS